jgi:hypothetical protein
MTEEFLVTIWKYGLFDRTSLISDSGENVEVIALGEHNAHAGPDFVNARIRIGNTLWAGNVEIHINASDWKKHHHQHDKAYDNVILQVVLNADQTTKRTNGTAIPTVALKFDSQLYANYTYLIGNKAWILCHGHIARIDPLILRSWLSSVMVERLESKTIFIDDLLEKYQYNWEEVFYILLARSFGFHMNADPFERTARSLPLLLLNRHKNNLFQLESLLFGQAGFLSGEGRDEYESRLKAEYHHLRHKYELKPVDNPCWKFMRLRPVNFPTVRLAQFAALICTSTGLFRKVIETEDLPSLIRLFSVSASTYWDNHYRFGAVTTARQKTLGTEASGALLINTVIPLVFFYGLKKGDDKLKTRAIELLSRMPAERNAVISRWGKAGVIAESALDSQALLELRSRYCQKKQCLKCMVGIKIVTRAEGQVNL